MIKRELSKKCYTPYDYQKINDKLIPGFCYENFKSIFSEGRVIAFVSGNILMDRSVKSIDKFYKSLNIGGVHELQIKDEIKEIKYPYLKEVRNKNKLEQNSIMLLAYKFYKIRTGVTEDWAKKRIFIDILSPIMDNQYFSQLRTVEQLGYIVKCRTFTLAHEYTKTFYMNFLIQSPTKKGKELLERTNLFIETQLNDYIENLGVDDFEKRKKSIALSLKEDFIGLHDLNIHLYHQIVDETFIFNINDIIIEELSRFTLEEFKNMFHRYITTNTNKAAFILDSDSKN